MSHKAGGRTITWVDRRAILKSIPVAIGGLGGIGTVQASEHETIARGPTHKTYVGETVNTEDVPEPVRPSDSTDGEEGGFTEEEIPFQRPEAGGKSDTGKGSLLNENAGDPIEIGANYDGFEFLDTVRSVDRDGDGEEELVALIPSDAQIGSGEDKHVSVINSEFGIFDKQTGSRDFEARLEDWFENVRSKATGGFFANNGFLVFDPRVLYDTGDDRYLVVCVEFNFEKEEGALLLSVSDDADPTGTWTNYRIPPLNDTGLVDFPKIGFDDNAVYLTHNFFSFTESFNARLIVLDKSDLLNGDTVDAWHFTHLKNPDGNRAFTIQPGAMPGHAGPFSLMNSRVNDGSRRTLTLWELSDPTGDPSISNSSIDVRGYSPFGAAIQPDTEDMIIGIGLLLENLAFDSEMGTLWTTHTINGDGAIRWYEINPTTQSIVQSGTFRRNGKMSYFPAVENNGDSTMMVYNVSGANDYPGIEVAGRTNDFEDGAIEAFESVKEGESAYDLAVDNPDTPRNEDGGVVAMRWGDYNGISVDPDGKFWVISQYASDPDNEFLFTTRIAQASF